MHHQIIYAIHGVGHQDPDYSQVFREDIRELLNDYSSADQTHIKIHFKEILWSDITQDIQDELGNRFETVQGMGQRRLRGMMLNLIGDALAYQDSIRGRAVYQAIHQRIDQARQAVESAIDADDTFEISFVAHSLGSVIASDYWYDHRHEFTLCNFFSMGSPIALWAMRAGHPDAADQPLQVERPHGVWINIYDDDDIIGWPLRVINDHYLNAVDFDYQAQIGGPISRTTPLSHRGYWTDGNAQKPIAKKLALDQERFVNNTVFDKQEYIQFINGLWNI